MAGSNNISLALQGGGTYGAFGWGVLDRLLQEETLAITAISGASAGAINAVVLADGYALGGGRAGARAALGKFWLGLGQVCLLSPLQPSPADYLAGRYTMEYSPGYQMMEMAAAMAGPVFEIPFTLNPLRNFLSAMVDFERVRACEELQLYIAATHVRSGTGKLFMRRELDVQRVMASCCLPTVFAAVEVEGETYWDGSYVANPPLAPLARGPQPRDVLIVQNNPVARREIPRTMADIGNRSDEIAFNVSFLRELASILHCGAVQDEERGDAMRPGPARLHLVSAQADLAGLSISSKMNAQPAFLMRLHDLGVQAADRWLAAHQQDIGLRSSFDPRPLFQRDPG
ncbi:patatin-like phospholipase family protein [Oxalobacteraceae bacterium A2-2]